MGSNALVDKGKLRGFGLVRNKQGKPQFNDYSEIPEIFYPLLSVEDWEYIEKQKEELEKCL